MLSSEHLVFLVVCLLLLLPLWKYKERHRVARPHRHDCHRCSLHYLHLFPPSCLRLAWLHNITVWAYVKLLGLDGGNNQMGSNPFVTVADQITSMCLIFLICKTSWPDPTLTCLDLFPITLSFKPYVPTIPNSLHALWAFFQVSLWFAMPFLKQFLVPWLTQGWHN